MKNKQKRTWHELTLSSGGPGVVPLHADTLRYRSIPFLRPTTLRRLSTSAAVLVAIVYAVVGSHGDLDGKSRKHLEVMTPAELVRRCAARRPRGGGADLPDASVGASYARYSSDLQDDASIDQQQRKCRDRATADGVSIRSEFEFADRAVSGTKRDRDGLAAMLSAARERRFGVLYFESLSRLARESVLTMPMLKELVYVHRIRVVSVSEGIDSAQANWDLLANFMSWVHEQYLKGLRAAVLRGQEEGVLNDFSVGDWCFGYTSEPIPGSEAGRRGRRPKPRMRVVVNPKEAEWVGKIFRWFVTDGWSITRIARWLTQAGVPKDHRSTTPGWHPQAVRRALRNEKYIGLWAWGKATNVRNPLTGQISQEGRPAEDVAKWVRHRPHLQLVDDATFAAAQAKLDQEEARCAAHRAADGRLRGSRAGTASPRHLLQGLIKCAACGGTFQVSGANGKYLGCAGYQKGVCAVKTRLPRQAAEHKLLAVIGEHVLDNPVWMDAVVQETRAAWEEVRRQNPDERVAVEVELTAVQAKIGRLVDAIEDGKGESTELTARLAERRRVRAELEAKLARLNASAREAEPPTREWVAERVAELGDTLRGSGAAAAPALRRLVGGKITVSEVTSADRKRKHLVGTFTLAKADALAQNSDGTPVRPASGEVVRVAFNADPPWTTVADAVKAEYDAGIDCRGIAAKLGCPYPWVGKALTWWHTIRGLPKPDARSERNRLTTRPSLAESLADRAKELWDGDRPLQHIAEALRCDRNTVTAAICHWFTSRGLPVPDGRSRRKEVRLRREGQAADRDGSARETSD